jgi:hypothetical protein
VQSVQDAALDYDLNGDGKLRGGGEHGQEENGLINKE